MAIQFKTYNGLPRWLTALIEVFLCSGVPTQFSLGIILVIIGWPATNPDGSLSLVYICTLALTDMVLLIGLMIWLMRLHGESISRLWLGSRSIMTEVFLGLLWIPLLLIAVATLLYIIRTITPELHNVIENPLEQLLHTREHARVVNPALNSAYQIVPVVQESTLNIEGITFPCNGQENRQPIFRTYASESY